MTRYRFFFFLTFLFFTVSCSSPSKTVTKVQESDIIEDDSWSPQDLQTTIREMTASIKNSKLNSPDFKNAPIILGGMPNDTDEQIDTNVIMTRLQTALSKEGFQFISRETIEDMLKKLTLQQSDLFDTSQSSKIGKLIGAKMILWGRISNMRKSNGKKEMVMYYLTFQIISLETGKILWTDEVTFGRSVEKQKMR
ncbi:MAG TPA: hypothetical protein DHW82_06990 [Spirochaetia bacterium]|nr:MAG: hypothetical protein A2Y41_03685 [Spirochaetes bacterium GWB1_36_13]HCL56739.1 hypothetical protein [Spirochaetia bacterium]